MRAVSASSWGLGSCRPRERSKSSRRTTARPCPPGRTSFSITSSSRTRATTPIAVRYQFSPCVCTRSFDPMSLRSRSVRVSREQRLVPESLSLVQESAGGGAHLDTAHVGDIRGALGTIDHGDIAPRIGWWPRLRTLLAILGPGLIVMAGDNDAGAFSTYSQAGQNYGNSLLWTLVLLLPVLYVNQEMVIRLR